LIKSETKTVVITDLVAREFKIQVWESIMKTWIL
jgi:hypothetical protein